VRLITFAALGLYGITRWGTLLHPAPTWRLLGLLALAVLLAGIGGILVRISRVWVLVALAVAVLLMFPIAGVPWSLIRHLRIAVTADRIGNAVTVLPSVDVPYTGLAEWTRIVNILGAGVLLLSGAFVLAIAADSLDDLGRAGAALPLVALVIVPATLMRPSLPYLQGLVLFALLAAFMWGERIRSPGVLSAIAVAGGAGIAGAILAPGLDSHKPWLNYEALFGKASAVHIDTFTWQQLYGPLRWPRTGHEVLDVKATYPEYWKAENLDDFDGYGWSQALVRNYTPLPRPAQDAVTRWTQTIQVTIRGMKTTDLIAAGEADDAPRDVPGQVLPGASMGTWGTSSALGPGASYVVSVYNPAPSATELQQAGDAYPASLAAYRSLVLPVYASTPLGFSTLVFPRFHSGQRVKTPGGHDVSVATVPPYAGAYRLSQQLARDARTPYDYVEAVLDYLHRGFVYDENPPPAAYPLETFLFTTKRGYCQQFSGAMALLLRMAGIPARVAAGFTSGSYNASTHQWVVSDTDAHDWVEVWFPRYGWVRFDPTPASAPARSSIGAIPILAAGNDTITKPHPVTRHTPTAASSSASTSATGRGGGSDAVLIIVPIVLLVALALATCVLLRADEPTNDQLLAELERALKRSRRPIGAGVTLAALEQRFGASPEAAGYIRSVRLTRFAGRSERPTLLQRRALRAQLAADLGFAGAIRAIWALPPRFYVAPRWAWLRWLRNWRPRRLN
jgi:hypothetical protein